jgi:flagellin
MGMTVRTNMAALSSIATLNKTQGSLSSSLEKISSGLRINRAGDDAAGLGVATRMETDNVSLKQAMRNTNDGISLVQTAEGSIEQLTNILIRFRELSVQASNETYTATDRGMIGTEMTALRDEYKRITTLANFNEQSLLNNASTLSIQVGIDSGSNNRIDIVMSDLATSLGSTDFASLAVVFAAGGLANATIAASAAGNLAVLDSAINELSDRRATLGSLQNRFENALAEASTYSTNLAASQSQILDVDYASESANMTRYQIQSQAGVAALAQAKAIPQSIISLLS